MEKQIVRSFTLALGEVSGHHHTVSGEIEVIENTDNFKAWKPLVSSILTHQEHDTMVFPKNRVVDSCIQKEYDPFAGVVRNVRD